jgi:hypothetical protein
LSTATFAAPLYVPKFRAFDSDGNPLAGGLVYTYIAGGDDPDTLPTYPTYDDALAGTNANSNPVVLDADGEAAIFGQNLFGYKVVVANSADVVQYTVDDVYIGRGTALPVISEWVPETGSPVPLSFEIITYVSGTSFEVNAVDKTSIYHAGRRVKTTNTGGTVYSTVVSSSFGTDTTVTLVNDSGTLDAGLSAVYYGMTSVVNPSANDPKTCVSVIKNGDQTDFDPVALITPWTEQIDSLSEFVTDTFTAKYPGKYLVNFQMSFSDSGTDVAVTAHIYVNGSAVSSALTSSDDTAAKVGSVSVHWVGSLSAGGTVAAYALGVAGTTVVGSSGTRLSITRVA